VRWNGVSNFSATNTSDDTAHVGEIAGMFITDRDRVNRNIVPFLWSLHSSDIWLGYGLDGRKIAVRFQARATTSRRTFGATHVAIEWVHWLFPSGKGAGSEVIPLPDSIGEFKIWTSAPLHIFIVLCKHKHRDNAIFNNIFAFAVDKWISSVRENLKSVR
jgi:hypothetical protein